MDVTYPIYTESEAIDRDIGYKPWKDCSVGDYGISDDGYIAECVKRTKYKKQTEMQDILTQIGIKMNAQQQEQLIGRVEEREKQIESKYKDCRHPYRKMGCCDLCGKDLIGE